MEKKNGKNSKNCKKSKLGDPGDLFNISFSNVDVFTKDKLNELIERNKDKNQEIISLVEVKPKNYDNERSLSEYKITGYEIIENNIRKDDEGRGMLMYIKNTVSYTEMKLPVAFREYQCIQVIGGDSKIVVLSVYRSPNSNSENDKELNDLLKEAKKLDHTHLVIMGDMNYPGIVWQDKFSVSTRTESELNFVECTRDNFLYQHVDEVTRKRGNNDASLIDLIFTNEEHMISMLNVDSPLGKSDHSVISLQIHVESVQEEKFVYCYDKANYEEIRNFLDIDWMAHFAGLDTMEAKWEFFKNRLLEAIEKFVPKIKVQDKKKSVDIKLRRKIRKKQRLWNRWRSGDQRAKTEYNRTRNQIRFTTRKLVRQRERKIAKNIKKNSKLFWRYVQDKTKIRVKIPDLLCEDQSLTKDDKEKAERLGEFFSSVFTREPDNIEMPEIEMKQIPGMPTVVITEERILKFLRNLKIDKSPGPDSINARILKEAGYIMALPLKVLFETSLESAELPSDWRNANITAIFKKGDKKKAGNYRPVSLTSIVCKILEAIIREDLIKHVMKYNLISKFQYGFMPGRSTTLQLIKVLDLWLETLDNKGCVDVIYCDFMKAFDKVPHKRLLHKLKTYRFGDRYVRWIEAFLVDRKQRVRVNGEFSNWTSVLSGIPQGTVLGPFLFVLYINDLPDSVLKNSHTYLFADDTKIFKGIFGEQDCRDLQDDISEIYKWSEKWLLKFHPDKCKNMRLGNADVPDYDYRLHENQDIIQKSTHEKDLGVGIDEKLKFDIHINEKVNKANSILGIITRTFSSAEREIMLPLYTSLVRPHLEYANQVWSPHLKKHIISIEKVQKRLTRMIPGMKDKPYHQRLKELNLMSLAYRRIRGDIIQLFKIMKNVGHDRDVTDFESLMLNDDDRTRGHSLKLKKFRPRLDIRKYSFTYRVIDIWNGLPQKVIDCKTVESFKNQIDILWQNQDIKWDHNANFSTGAYGSYNVELNEEASQA